MQDDFGQLRVRLQQRTEAPVFRAIRKDITLNKYTYNAIS